MYPAACKEGTHFDENEKKRPWHEEETKRWARHHSAQDDREGLWDVFGRSHMAEAQATNRASATQCSSCSGVVRAGGFAARGAKETVSSPHAGSRDAGGKKRPRQAHTRTPSYPKTLHCLLPLTQGVGWTRRTFHHPRSAGLRRTLIGKRVKSSR